jgi:hypothetical protein
MGVFEFLFGKLEEAAPSQPASATAAPQDGGRPLRYDPSFIPQLMEEHRSLLLLFSEIRHTSQSRDFSAVQRALQKFQMALNLHLAVENANFYAYLRKNLKGNTPEHDTMTAFFEEMQEMGKVVSQFLRKYNYSDFTAEMQSAFSEELEQIGAALVSRINREEESLYKLYVPA